MATSSFDMESMSYELEKDIQAPQEYDPGKAIKTIT